MNAAKAAEAIALHGGAATFAELCPDLGRRALLRAVDDGALTRVGRGLYKAAPVTPVALARILGGQVSHLSAAVEHGVEVLHPPEAVHLTIPRSASRRGVPPGVVLHRADLDRSGGPVTTPLRTLRDCARTLPLPASLAVVDSALREGLVHPPDVQALARTFRGPGATAARQALACGDGRAASVLESALRAVLVIGGLDGFIPQYEIREEGHLVARVDLAEPQARVALEADSFAWHGDREALTRDCGRVDELHALGWLVLRFAWEHILQHPAWVRQKVRAVLAHRRTTRPPRQPFR